MNSIQPWKQVAALLLIAAVTGGAASAGGDGTWDLSFLVAGGGGGSAAGSYAVAGTAGQAVAGAPAVGAGLTVTGGWWAAAVGGPSSVPSPILAAEPAPGGLVRIRWRRPADGFVLERSAHLPGTAGAASVADWVPVTAPHVTNGLDVLVTVPAAGSGFFRLRRP